VTATSCFPDVFHVKELHHLTVPEIGGLLIPDSNRVPMRISIKHAILLLTISSAFVGLTQAASCGGSCAIGSTYDFLGDPSISMDSVDGLESHIPLSINPFLNQTSHAYVIKNSFVVRPIINRGLGNMTSDNSTVILGSGGMQYNGMSTLAFTALRIKF
jgi:hypothetical protein